MNALLVVAHPLPGSLCRHLADVALRELASAGHETTVLDLYQEDFDPRLTADERRSYYEPRYDHVAIADHAVALRSAEILIFVFPTWWFGMPAVLKGWIDRTFAPGVAFAHGEDFGPIRPLLTRLRHVVTITTLGSPWWVDWLVMRRPLPRIFRRAIIRACAPQARVDVLSFHSAENLARQRLRRFEWRIGRAIGKTAGSR